MRGSTSKARLTENRSKLVRARTIKLENDCKVVQRVLWRTDGLALDWILNRERGIYREFWPVDDCDRSDFAKRVAQRCRSMGGGRTVLSTKKAVDVVEVAWMKLTEEVPPAVPEDPISVSINRKCVTLGLLCSSHFPGAEKRKLLQSFNLRQRIKVIPQLQTRFRGSNSHHPPKPLSNQKYRQPQNQRN